MLTSYGPAIVFLLIGVVVAVAFGMAPRLLGPRRAVASRQSQLTPYECGLPSEVTRTFRFGISFYLVAMLFILFDIEVLFLFPIGVQLREFGTFGLAALGVFLGPLVIALIYEWRRGGLQWK